MMNQNEKIKVNIQSQINRLNNNEGGRFVAQLSDGYHTFDELYQFRMMYNAALFNEWGKQSGYHSEPITGEDNTVVNFNYYKGAKHLVHKSWKHHDGEDCFGGGWFIVSAMLPTGLISNHYRAEHWDLFKIPEVEKALFPFDGHTPQNVLERLKNL